MKAIVLIQLFALVLAVGQLRLEALNPSVPHSFDCRTRDSLDLAQVFSENIERDTFPEESLSLDVDGLYFFHNNEFDGNVSRGYTLPGFRMRPRLIYAPSKSLQLELGAHALIFNGANKYPNYAFHDIVKWKGTQYQEGAHLLPLFRAKMKMGSSYLVLGSLYGGGTHQFILPMYNPESILSTDPEFGVQLQVLRERWKLDLWLDWQSFIFDRDTHQEAFTIGMAQRLELLGGVSRSFSLVLPLQVLAQHRGGEHDLPELGLGVQTLCNASLGLQARWGFGSASVLNALELEGHVLTSYQQAGKFWPFEWGLASWAVASMEVKKALRFRLGVFHAKDYANLYGSPFFGTLSLKEVGGRFSKMTTGYWSVEYARHWGANYSLGVKAEGYLTSQGRLSLPDASFAAPRVGNAFSFGVFFRASPRFLLKSFSR